MTYAEFSLACMGYKEVIKRGLSEAWWTANLSIAAYHAPKKFPKFERILGEKKYKNDQKEKEMNDWYAELRARRAARKK